MQRGLVGSEMCIRDSINAEYMGYKDDTIMDPATNILNTTVTLPIDVVNDDMFNITLVDGAGNYSEYTGANFMSYDDEAPLITGLTVNTCLLYTSDAADDTPCVDLGGRRIIKKKKQKEL
eukprot:TRINITY_DN58497_c0_g1_i2.p2 TRINITY_DN58497_c0_g1~~TRINITY_DN58497_c0_g1_i2.p2  ORF type:complete len:120 (-),score=40.87 TRINITY_DN58497_c0_g1_i2:31-390(-)